MWDLSLESNQRKTVHVKHLDRKGLVQYNRDSAQKWNQQSASPASTISHDAYYYGVPQKDVPVSA